MQRTVSRAEALRLGLKRYFTGKPCKYGHVAERRAHNGHCCECYIHWKRKQYWKDPENHRKQAREYQDRHRDERRAYTKKYRIENRDRVSETSRKWRTKNLKHVRSYREKYYTANREKLQADSREYYSKHRDERLAWASKYRTEKHDQVISSTKRWRAENPEHVRSYGRRYRTTNRDYLLSLRKAWGRLNPGANAIYCNRRRARKNNRRGEKYTIDDVRQLIDRQNGQCVYYGIVPSCAKDITDVYHIDHKVPFCLGGTDDLKNIQITCPGCNLRKGRQHPDVFIASMKEFA